MARTSKLPHTLLTLTPAAESKLQSAPHRTIRDGLKSPKGKIKKLSRQVKRTISISSPAALEFYRQLNNLKGQYEAIVIFSREALDALVAIIYDEAMNISAYKSLTSLFIADPCWKQLRQKPKTADDVLRFMFLRTIDNKKKASRYYLAVKSFFEQRLPAADLPAEIRKNGGYAELEKKAAKPQAIKGNVGNKETQTDHQPSPAAAPKFVAAGRANAVMPLIVKSLTVTATLNGQGQQLLSMPTAQRLSCEISLDELAGQACKITIYSASLKR